MAKVKKTKRMGAMAQRPAAPGMAPGMAVEAPADAHQTRLDAIVYNADHLTRFDNVAVASLPPLTEGSVVWIHVTGLQSVDTITALADRFDLHKLLVEDIFNVEARPKAEAYGETLFVQVKLPPHERGGLMDQMSIIARHGLVISIDEAPGDCFEPVRGRLEKNGPIRMHGADYLLYALIDSVTDGFFPALESEGMVLDELEDSMRNPTHAPPLSTIHRVKRRLLAIRRVVWPLRELIASLMRENQVMISESVRLYFRDTYDHSVELVDLIELYRETANGLAELSLAIVSARMNDVMKFLTIISTIFMPLTFIVGVYGMNFDRSFPLNMPELGWKYGYLFSLGLMAVITICFLIYFRRRGLLGRPGETFEED